MADYETKAIISTIKATSRASVKIRDSYFTVEYSEDRVIPQVEGVDIEQERLALWDAVNAEVDNQIDLIVETMKSK